jgi:hypothetical protein
MSGPGVSIADLSNFASNTANIDDIISLDVMELGNGPNATRNLDMDLLANQNKVTPSPNANNGITATPYSSSGSTFEISNPPPVPTSSIGDGIDFINIEDTQKTVTLNTPQGSGLSGVDTIHINRSNDYGAENLESLPIGGAAAPAPAIAVSVPKLTPEQEATEKAALLNKLRRLQTKGIEGAKMNMTNSLEEIKAEYARLNDSAGLEKSIKFQRQMLVTCVTGLEFLNQRFNPADVNLEGWSESVNENQDDFDEIFEELYDKYKDRSKVAPEVRLVMTLGMSAAMCHVTNTFFKSKMPGMDDILKRNPDLARQFAQAAASQSVGPGFANFMSMGQPGGGGQREREPNPMPFGGGGGGLGSSGWSPEEQTPPSPAVQTARREMRGPSGVEDILKAFEAEDRGEPVSTGFIPPPRPDAGDDNQSIYTSTTMNGSEAAARRSGRGGNRKAKPAVASINLVV